MLNVSITQIPLVSFALIQNDVSVIRSIIVENTSENNYENLKVQFSFDPEFADTFVEHIISLPAGETWQRTDIQPPVNASFICNLTEKVVAKTKVTLLSNDDEILAETFDEVSVLDYCQYWGNSFMSQYLAAFVTPRHIALDAIIKRASELLFTWTGDSSLTAYTHDVPQRPKLIVGAIYEAIAEQKITYCVPTTTLTKLGQKIRTCEDLLSEDRGKRGCCLDMALLMCSCLEAVGMHPLLVVQEEHAFAGCWLVNEMFADSINDDPTMVTKRTALGINEIILVETTCANDGNNIEFDKAVVMANDKIKNVKDFAFVLDVARARLAGVRPLPQRIFDGEKYIVDNPEPEHSPHYTPGDVGETFIFTKEDEEFNRFDLWERRLLDLSTRNNLLNIKFRKNTLRLMVPSLSEIVQLLEKDKEIQVLERPDDWENPVAGNNLAERIDENDPVMTLLRRELLNDKMRSFQDVKTLPKTLTGLYRTSRLSIEESGANTLYVALGFLKWYEPASYDAHFAPIALYPIRLERKSANKGYYIISRDEDVLLNETLFEYLKQNYGILIPDVTAAVNNEQGLDIKYIMAAIRKAVMEQGRWDVVEESTISIFDFNRFVIWNDLRNNREKMSQHPLISSLVSGLLNEHLMEDADVVEEDLPSSEVALPISADSSQLAAIKDAAAGTSFVLHGPPGTGKSQTITNIISNALFHGKRVLFVAEKMAALEVVQKRLASIGLAPFCLELHSNKTKKSLVMEQLRRTTEVIRRNADSTFANEAAHLDELKNELNAHVEHLHKKYKSGLSVYECFAQYYDIELSKESIIKISEGYIEELTPEHLREHLELLENFKAVATVVAEHGNALREINLLEYSPNIRGNIKNLIGEVKPMIEPLKSLAENMSSIFHNMEGDFSRQQYKALNYIVEFILNEDNVTIPSGFIINFKDNLLINLSELIKQKVNLDKHMATLLERYSEHILELDYVPLRHRWINAENKWFLPKFLDRNSVLKTISSYSKNPRSVNKSSILALFGELDELHRIKKDYEEMLVYMGNIYDVTRELKNADVNTLHSYYEILNGILDASNVFMQSGCDVLSQLADALRSGWNNFKERNKETLRDYNKSYIEFSNKLVELEDATAATLNSNENDWLLELIDILSRWEDNIDHLRNKVAYNIVREKLNDNSLYTVVEYFENIDKCQDGIEIDECEILKDKSQEIIKVYKKSLYQHCANYYISKDKELSFFQSMLFEDKIKRFRKLCHDFEELTRRELIVRITHLLPALRKEAALSSDVGYLQKCIRNGCRGISIRKFFDTIPDLISRICPAMLMSPLSVSQYLSSEWSQFDLVIFDEASQMPTCEAIASISRGKSVVIVGDEHQLPPTSFFMTENFSEQHSENEDLESILEDCLALSMPQRYLLWHYRSKHESLITFSNRHFYKNSLMTFPSNDDMATKVSFEFVNGIYDRGSERNNKEEAKAVVEEIKKRLSDDKTASQSIGVVTFNVNQQALIEDMLNDMLRKNPDLELVAAKMHEPVFIKNLENVQGDERDVILFSVGYGRDKFGKVAMNFGPLNRDGGERRLNVAVSRARYEMKVFSSLRGEDVDIYRSNAKGVKYLRSFLEYAERGKVALANVEYSSKQKTKDMFVHSVAEAIRARGYDVNTNIGSSEYRVDIGVIDPTNPERYMLGLLCDGYNYTTSSNARDRDVTTPAVLSLLGWQTYNIWSVEWWDTPEQVLNAIIRKIEQILAERGDGIMPDDSSDVDVEDNQEPDDTTSENISEENAACATNEYRMAKLEMRHVETNAFYQGRYTKSVMNNIRRIIDAEAPISQQTLIKRLLNSYDVRKGTRVNVYLTEIFSQMELTTSGTDDVFYWKDEEQRDNYSGYRTASGREALDIAPEEVAQAVVQVVRDQFAIDEEGLIRETSELFGFASVRENVAASMRRGIEYAVSKNMIVLDEMKYRIN